jgi:chromosome segregation ATPase
MSDDYERDPQVEKVLNDMASTRRQRDQLLNEAEEYRQKIAVLETKLKDKEDRLQVIEKRCTHALGRLFELTTYISEIKRTTDAADQALKAAARLKDLPDDGAARIAERFKPVQLAQS